MFRAFYIALIIAYAVMFVAYFFKYEISYRMVKVRPEIVMQRSLTQEEYKELKRAEIIRHRINFFMLLSSIIIAVVSAIFWYFNLFSPPAVVKIVFIISGLWAIILMVVNGIHFIPNPPIR